jgi:hypothetical protein
MGQAGKERASSGIATWGVHTFHCQVYQVVWPVKATKLLKVHGAQLATSINVCFLKLIYMHGFLIIPYDNQGLTGN